MALPTQGLDEVTPLIFLQARHSLPEPTGEALTW